MQYGQLFQIPRQTHQRPFVADVDKAPQHELPELHHRLDDAEHRFHRLLAQCVLLLVRLGLERVLHRIDRTGIRRQLQLGFDLACVFIGQRAVTAGIGVQLGAVEADAAESTELVGLGAI